MIKALAHRWVERPERDLREKIAKLRDSAESAMPNPTHAVLLDHIEQALALKAAGKLPSLALAQEKALLSAGATLTPPVEAPSRAMPTAPAAVEV